MVKRFDIRNAELNPTIGSEINKIRPCLIVSPDEVNNYLNTVVVVPLTIALKPYPTRIDCQFHGKRGQLAIDQIRCLDKTRLGKKMGELDNETSKKVCAVIVETFRY
ncbi:MAG: type II toxin-antitoxin system PemK/MazF family toxin [Bacteroidales bacterium]|nr:type II toxin-antitoxin system PemK/MazF family toxin [Bacteroidales bacterium]